jgi:hypothetical protein
VGAECKWDIATKEATAIHRMLLARRDSLRDTHVDVHVDNQSVIHAWNNERPRSPSLLQALKQLFFTTLDMNVVLHLVYIPTQENPADLPSRRLSCLDSHLTHSLWNVVQRDFGGPQGHTCDLMALDSNAMSDLAGQILPHFTPSPGSAGVNFFAQNFSQHQDIMQFPYVFPPAVLVGPVLSVLCSLRQPCTIVVIDAYPRQYWWPLLVSRSRKSLKLALKDESGVLLVPSNNGWVPHPGLPGDLWVFALEF